jgi:SAM-dependent methyltransferase
MNPALYHAHHNRYLEDLPFWLNQAAQAGSPILELGCGTGRVVIPLAQSGYQAFGLDHDLSMLRYLKDHIPLSVHNSTHLMAADLCEFNLMGKFPLIILSCNTYSTLNDTQRQGCLRCVRNHLQNQGIFAVSIPNPELLIGLPNRGAEELEDEFIHPDTGNPVQVSNFWNRTKNSLKTTCVYDHLFPDGSVDRQMAPSIQHIVPLNTHITEVERAGLQVNHIYGGYDRSVYSSESPYLILLIARNSC